MEKKTTFSSPTQNIHREKFISKQIRELFENPDFDVVPIIVSNDRHAVKEFREIISIFHSSNEWDVHLKALTYGMSLVKGGACNFISFIQQIPNLLPLFQETLLSFRSTLVKFSCLFIAQLAINLQTQFENTMDSLIPLVFKQTGNGTQIIADSCTHALLMICRYVQSPKVIKAITNEVSSKSAVHRSIVGQSICIIISSWDYSEYSKSLTLIEKTIQKLLTDASPDARAYAREANSLLFQNLGYGVATNSALKRRAYSFDYRQSIDRKKFNMAKPELNIEAIKNYIVQDDTEVIKANADEISKIVVRQMYSDNPLQSITAISLFPEIVFIIPDPFELQLICILDKALSSANSHVPRYQRLGSNMLTAVLKAFGPRKVLSSAIKLDNAKDYLDFITATLFADTSLLKDEEILSDIKALSKECSNIPSKLRSLIDSSFSVTSQSANESTPSVSKGFNSTSSVNECDISLKKPKLKLELNVVSESDNYTYTDPPIDTQDNTTKRVLFEQIDKETSPNSPDSPQQNTAVEETPPKNEKILVNSDFSRTQPVHKATLVQEVSKRKQNISIVQDSIFEIPENEEVKPKPVIKFVESVSPPIDRVQLSETESSIDLAESLKTNSIELAAKNNYETGFMTIRPESVAESSSSEIISDIFKSKEWNPRRQSSVFRKNYKEEAKLSQFSTHIGLSRGAKNYSPINLEDSVRNSLKDELMKNDSIPPFATERDPPFGVDDTASKLVIKLDLASEKALILKRINTQVLKSQGKDSKIYIPALLKLMRTEFREDAEECINNIIKMIGRYKTLDIIIPLMNDPNPRDAIEYIGRLAKQSSLEVRDKIGWIMPKLINLSTSQYPEIRKSAVFCVVDLWLSLGPSFESEVLKMTPVSRKLVSHYYEQKK